MREKILSSDLIMAPMGHMLECLDSIQSQDLRIEVPSGWNGRGASFLESREIFCWENRQNFSHSQSISIFHILTFLACIVSWLIKIVLFLFFGRSRNYLSQSIPMWCIFKQKAVLTITYSKHCMCSQQESQYASTFRKWGGSWEKHELPERIIFPPKHCFCPDFVPGF